MLEKPLTELEIEALGLLADEPERWHSSGILARQMRRGLLTGGVMNALVGLELRGLAEQDKTKPWKFRVTLEGQAALDVLKAGER